MKPEKTIPVLDLTPQIEELWTEFNDAIQRVLKSGQFISGPEVQAFEAEVADYLGVKHAVGLNSGTDALVIGLRALGIGTGDEVITTPFSFFATAESISSVGAKPVFVDIEEDSMNIDPNLIEAAITSKTKAIMPVHIFGRPAAMMEIMSIADKYDLKVIEDCAQSFGAKYYSNGEGETFGNTISGQLTGTIGDIGAYSFFPTKNLGAFGDGGLLVTNDDVVAEQVKMLHKHGAKTKYNNEIVGFNSRLDALQAAILRVKLPYIDLWNTRRRKLAEQYNEYLCNLDNVVLPDVVKGHIFHQYTIRLLFDKRDEVKDKLLKAGIQSMIYYPTPQDKLPVYIGKYNNNNPKSDNLAEEVLSIPIWPEMRKLLQQKISKEIILAVS